MRDHDETTTTDVMKTIFLVLLCQPASSSYTGEIESLDDISG